MSKLLEVRKSEKNRILERHNSFNKKISNILETRLLLENELTGVALLDAARKEPKCKLAYGGKFIANPQGDRILTKIADYDSTNGYFVKGDTLYIKGDRTFAVKKANGGKVTQGYRWDCPALKPAPPEPPKPQQLSSDCKAQRANAVKLNWLTWDQLIATGVDTRTIGQQYKQHNICNEMFYEFLPGGVSVDPSKTSAQSAELQEKFIDTWGDYGWIPPDQAPLERRAIMDKKTPEELDPNAKGLFPAGTFFYYDPERAQKGIGGGAKTNYTKQIPTKDNCKNDIELFYDSWDNQVQFVPAQMADLKKQVQRCKAVFHNKGKWGFLGGGKELDRKLDVLSGMVSGQGPGKRDPYRLQ